MDKEGHIDFSDLGEDANHLRQCQPVLGPAMYADEKEAVGPAPGQWGYAAPAEGGAGTDLPGPETAILRLLFIRKRLPLGGSLQTVEKVQPMLGFFHYLCYNNHG